MPPSPCDVPVVGRVCEIPGQVAESVASSAWGGLVGAFIDGVGQATRLLFTFWTEIPSPDLEEPGGTVEFLRSSTSWYVGALAVAAFLVAAARIVITHRGEHAALLVQGMVRLVAATALGVPVVTGLLAAGDAYSDWILDRAAGGDFAGRLVAIADVASLIPAGVGSAVVFLLAFLALAAAIAQMGLMFVRAGMLVLLVGLWPLSASLSNTESGKAWWDRTNGWLVAFVLYKPVAATVYGGAFVSIGESPDVTGVVSGVFLLVLAVATLPALMRLAVPATAATAGGGGGGGGAALGGALATGAVAVGGGRSGGIGLMAGGGPGAGAAAGLRSPSGAASAGAGDGAGRSQGQAQGQGGDQSQGEGGQPSGSAGAGAVPAASSVSGGGAAAGGPPGVVVLGQAVQAGQAAAQAAGQAGEAAAGEERP